MAEKVLAKDRALNPERIARIGREVKAALPSFDADAFVVDVTRDLPRLELKARIARTATGLHDHLPVAGTDALDVLIRSLPPTPKAAGISNDFGLHIYSPHSDYVARYCRTAEDLAVALDALRRFTCYFSAEDAVRHFLNDFPQQTMAAVNAWAKDDNYRVRRLASESTRPTLPWSTRVNLTVDAALPILEQLYDDPSRYVTQSVANHLRDIAATTPDLVTATLSRWTAEGRARPAELNFIAREALRTKVKQGWRPAYRLLGFAGDLPVGLSPVHLEHDELTDGGTLAFTTQLTCPVTAPIHVMYAISSITSRGHHREKVYFLARTTVQAGQPLTLAKRHTLRSTTTTRLDPGPHTLEIQVNGNRFNPVQFQVLRPL